MTKITLLIALITAAISFQAAAGQQSSAAAKAEFKRLHPCPANAQPRGPCPGYIVDHITALACGGPDTPENMQWQTVEDAKAKDRWERIGCSR